MPSFHSLGNTNGKYAMLRIDNKNRTRLETVIPLSTPFIINVDPCDVCNLACRYCPTSNRSLMKATPGRNFGSMSFTTFEKIIEDLHGFDKKIKVLRLYKDGEPLLNRRFVDMVKLAKSSGCCERVDTTTNGKLLHPDFNRQLIDSGIDRINISLNGMTSSQYMEFCRSSMDMDRLIKGVLDLYEHRGSCEIFVKINQDTVPPEDVEKFRATFDPSMSSVEYSMACWPNFDNPVPPNSDIGIYGQEPCNVQVCPYVFYSMSINANGSASACFLDWNRSLLIGDVHSQSVSEIWHGERLRYLQRLFLRCERATHDFCGHCGQMTHGMPDNIDAYADELLKRLESAT